MPLFEWRAKEERLLVLKKPQDNAMANSAVYNSDLFQHSIRRPGIVWSGVTLQFRGAETNSGMCLTQAASSLEGLWCLVEI